MSSFAHLLEARGDSEEPEVVAGPSRPSRLGAKREVSLVEEVNVPPPKRVRRAVHRGKGKAKEEKVDLDALERSLVEAYKRVGFAQVELARAQLALNNGVTRISSEFER
jgi:hypothetical protein